MTIPASDFTRQSLTSTDGFLICMPVTTGNSSPSASKTPLHYPLMPSPTYPLHPPTASKIGTTTTTKDRVELLSVQHAEDPESNSSIANKGNGETTLPLRRRHPRSVESTSTAHPSSSCPDRREMQRRITTFLLGRLDRTQSPRSRILQRKFAKQWSFTIETCLYKTCATIEEYADLATLEERVEAVGAAAARRRQAVASRRRQAMASRYQQSQRIPRSNQRHP